MLFFFKKKKLVVDAFVSESQSHAYNYAPIDHANKFYPEWWKKLPKTEFDWNILQRKNESMRLCSGFTDHFSRGLIIPMWSDLSIKTDETGFKYQYSDGISSCGFHRMEQRKGFYEDHQNVKIISPWVLKSEKNVLFTMLPAMWCNPVKPNYEVALGTINFYYQSATHINLLIPGTQNIFIHYREPVVHIIPQSEREIDLRRHIVSDSEFEGFKKDHVSFIGGYHKAKKYREETEKDQKSKCPFSGILK